LTLLYLLDTSTVSRIAAPIPDYGVESRVQEHADDCAIASIVWLELLYGFERMQAGARKQRLNAFLHEFVAATFVILPYDEAAAAWHASERVRLEKQGMTPPILDGQIAAVAAVNGLTVVTANVRHFETFGGITIDDWSTPPT
jgi:tRNA(fMet)-specific endonuclease VapC